MVADHSPHMKIVSVLSTYRVSIKCRVVPLFPTCILFSELPSQNRWLNCPTSFHVVTLLVEFTHLTYTGSLGHSSSRVHPPHFHYYFLAMCKPGVCLLHFLPCGHSASLVHYLTSVGVTTIFSQVQLQLCCKLLSFPCSEILFFVFYDCSASPCTYV